LYQLVFHPEVFAVHIDSDGFEMVHLQKEVNPKYPRKQDHYVASPVTEWNSLLTGIFSKEERPKVFLSCASVVRL
jgi:hypothetical protein